MCPHSFVPDAFGHGVTDPVIKDPLADTLSTSTYRPLTLRPIIFDRVSCVNFYRAACNADAVL